MGNFQVPCYFPGKYQSCNIETHTFWGERCFLFRYFFGGQKLDTFAVVGAKGCRNGHNCGKKVVKKHIYQQITRPFVERRKSLQNKSSWHPPNNISTLFGGQPVRETKIQKKSFCNYPSGSLMPFFRETDFQNSLVFRQLWKTPTKSHKNTLYTTHHYSWTVCWMQHLEVVIPKLGNYN